jgi:hypothetical protein
MRRPSLFRRAGPGGEHLEVAIALQRISIDDRAAVMLGQRQRQRGFATRGRPGDNDDGVLAQLIVSFEARRAGTSG